MRTFRRPFWKSSTSKFELRYFIGLMIIGTIVVCFATHFMWIAVICWLLIYALMLLPIFTHYFYVILTEDRLILQNSIYTFWRKEYLYRDIWKVEFKQDRYTYVKVNTAKSKKFSWMYVISLVDPDEFDELMDMLNEKGVIVETDGLDWQYPNRKRSVNSVPDIEKCRIYQKVFRRSLGTTEFAQRYGITILLLAILGGPFLLVFFPIWTYAVFIVLCIIVFFGYFFRCKHVILTEYQLIFASIYNRVMFRGFFFCDIERVTITRGKHVCEVIMRDRTISPKRFDITLVPPADYEELVECLKAKGVDADIV